MNHFILVFSVFVLFSCKINLFLSQDLNKNEMEKMDSLKVDCYTFVGLIDKGDRQDTIYQEHCIERNATIFIQGRDYKYKATVLNTDFDTLSLTNVMIRCTNHRTNSSPKNQMDVQIIFERSISDSMLLNSISGNSNCCNWYDTVIEGITENVEKIWIHPIRVNQFSLTEIAGFPEVRLPLSINKKWNRSVTLGNFGWGDWCNKTVLSDYTVVAKKSFNLDSNNIDCWEIESVSTFDGKINKHNFFFNEKYGFVQMNYEFYNEIKIQFEMIEEMNVFDEK